MFDEDTWILIGVVILLAITPIWITIPVVYTIGIYGAWVEYVEKTNRRD